MISPLLLQNILPKGNLNDLLGSDATAKGGIGRKHHFAKIFDRLIGQKQGGASNLISGKTVQGHAFLEQLKKKMMALGLPLDQFTANDQALSVFGKLLVGAGFKQQEVKALLADLKEQSGRQGGVLVSDVFKAASRLTPTNSRTHDMAELDISALPYVETILSALGMPPDQIQQILADVKSTDGIDIEGLISNLKQKLSSVDYQPSDMGKTSKEDLFEMMKRIGLTSASESVDSLEAKQAILASGKGENVNALNLQSGSLTLGKFVAALEARLAADQPIGQQNVGLQSTTGDKAAVNEFFQNLTTVQNHVDGKVEAATTISVGAGQALKVTETRQEKGLQRDRASFPGANSKEASASPLSSSGKTVLADTDLNSDSQGLMGKNSAKKESALLMSLVKNDDKGTAERDALANNAFVKELKTAETPVGSTSNAGASPRTLPGYLLDQVSRQIIRLRQANQQEITLQLKPPHLGRMKMSIEPGSGGIKVNIIVEQHATRDMLLSQSNDLKAALTEQGLQLDKIDVETQADFERSMAHARQGREHTNGGKQRGSKQNLKSSSEPSVDNTEQTIPVRDDGLLNLVA